MKYTCLVLALVGAVTAIPQGVASAIAPSSSPPEGCTSSYSGEFEITAVRVQTKRDLAERGTCGTDGSLTLSLSNGILTDQKGRIGSIVANYQFQFDGPPAQSGAIYTAGWSTCSNGSLALGGSAVFYQCLSGTFYNLYDRSWAPQCTPVEIALLPCSGSSSSKITAAADGQPQGTAVAQITDGQIQAQSAPAISEKSDGQPQMPTAAPLKITQISDGQAQAPAATPITQITDGQPQAPTGAPVSQISDGQVQAPSATTGAPISQISDGQVQVGTSTPVSSSPTHSPAPSVSSNTGTTVFSMGADFATFFAIVVAMALL